MEKINEEVLCVLRKNKATNQIEIDYVQIKQHFAQVIDGFSALCDNQNVTLEQIINFIDETSDLNQLANFYRYCVFLNGTYQSFTANNQEVINEILQCQRLMLLKQSLDPERYNLPGAIAEYKEKLKAKYILWRKAYSINKTYSLCQEDESVIAFSHRIDGWSNPVYNLTANFSVEIKTNFGYGRASYFYTKLKYKDIEIIPFSEWIDYEFAKFSEIIRYTRSHQVRNEHWLEAMEFSRDACNISISDEIEFVEIYVYDECERMVSGLEDFLKKDRFSFKNREKNKYMVDKQGHILIEFRGEKISGALDFISKILEFENITSVRSFIDRIEVCNRSIQPILADESKIIKDKILNLTDEKNILKPRVDMVIEENNNYNKKRLELQKTMVSDGKIDISQIDPVELDNQFISKYPEYLEFVEEYKKVTETFRILTERIQNLTKVYESIVSYNEKITLYFDK